MADIKGRARPSGGEGGHTEQVYYHDEGDATFSESVAAHLRLWDPVGLVWIKGVAAPDGSIRVVSGAATASTGLLFAVVDTASSGDNTIVVAVTAKKIKVASYALVANAAVACRWKSGAGTSLSGAMSFAANGGISAPGTPGSHWFETAVNQNLVLNLGAAVQVSGHVGYFTEA